MENGNFCEKVWIIIIVTKLSSRSNKPPTTTNHQERNKMPINLILWRLYSRRQAIKYVYIFARNDPCNRFVSRQKVSFLTKQLIFQASDLRKVVQSWFTIIFLNIADINLKYNPMFPQTLKEIVKNVKLQSWSNIHF